MINLSQRSYEKELMDGVDIPFAAMAQTLRELNIVNTYLGGHAITIDGVKRLAGSGAQLQVCEMGCGGGDNLYAIYKYCARHGISARFTGIDINPECISFAKQQYPQLPCTWICSDYAAVNFEQSRPAVIFSSLFCHHFTDEQLVGMLQWMERNAGTGFFINDLQRHRLAFYLIRYITRIFSRSYLVRHDASLSVARSFRRHDWLRLFENAGLTPPSISWRWAFRYLVVFKKMRPAT